VKYDPNAGPTLTLFQFGFLVLLLLPSNLSFKDGPSFIPRRAPFWWYILLTAIFFTTSILTNLSFAYRITQPVHTVARSSSLAVSLVLGVVFFGAACDFMQMVSVALITLGISVTLNAESYIHQKEVNVQDVINSQCSGLGCNNPTINMISEAPPTSNDYFVWCIGICMLLVALVLSALLGHLQQWGYKRWGRAGEECKFYTHFLSLFVFLFTIEDIQKHMGIWSSSPLCVLPYFPITIGIPEAWLYVTLNVLTQWVCVIGVYDSMAQFTALTTTLFLTLRKFISLIVSVLYFNNQLSWLHWLGVLFVFFGSLLYKDNK